MNSKINFKLFGAVMIGVLTALVVVVLTFTLLTPNAPDGDAVAPDDASVSGVECPDGRQVCPDGTYVTRDPNNACQFPSCPQDISVSGTQVNTCCNQNDWFTCETEEEQAAGVVACTEQGCAACQQ